ncbi:MAG: haloacid dehalogenase-like hydrolase [Clostridia bacterium]|nr:haloacid dehalogenase-like hydrolase [Clostridia bacterium]
MNVYDFDKTIFVGDTEDRFFDFMFKQKGFRHYKPIWHFWNTLNKLGLMKKTRSRELQYSFLKKIDRMGNLDAQIKAYWDEIEQYMMPWYDKVKRPDDVIASGTPRFILEPIVKKLGIGGLVATEMDTRTGKIDGDFAVGEFKVVNFRNQYGLDCIDKFYSDAWSDHFLAEYAKEAYIVHEDETIDEWNAWFEAHPEDKGKKQFR